MFRGSKSVHLARGPGLTDIPHASQNNSSVKYLGDRGPAVTLDWINSKNMKFLSAANHRESFQLQKLSQALDSSERLEKSCWRREERKVRKALKKLVRPHRFQSQTQFQRMSRDSDVGGWNVLTPDAVSLDTQEGEYSPCFSRSPHSTACRPQHGLSSSPTFSQLGMSPSAHKCQPPAGMRATARASQRLDSPHASLIGRHLRSSCQLSQAASRTSFCPENTCSVPHLPGLAARPSSQLSPDLRCFQDAMMGYTTLQRRVRDLQTQARSTEHQARRATALHPLEALSCRYLRLTDSNIRTLLEQCRDCGIHVDIHPHMKDSEIDIGTIFQSSPTPPPAPNNPTAPIFHFSS
ncbi:uncharacterized protein [Lepisosteus oculatus]|uniref:uncharacterized protein n=1 Tax=Lepisosteus oculatus TaxID=7918 RepID=UPI0035F51CF6